MKIKAKDVKVGDVIKVLVTMTIDVTGVRTGRVPDTVELRLENENNLCWEAFNTDELVEKEERIALFPPPETNT